MGYHVGEFPRQPSLRTRVGRQAPKVSNYVRLAMHMVVRTVDTINLT